LAPRVRVCWRFLFVARGHLQLTLRLKGFVACLDDVRQEMKKVPSDWGHATCIKPSLGCRALPELKPPCQTKATEVE
jgi:hypothetical protein